MDTGSGAGVSWGGREGPQPVSVGAREIGPIEGIRSVIREGPEPMSVGPIEDITMYAGGADVPMTQLDATPGVPPGMSSVQPQAMEVDERSAMTRDEKAQFLTPPTPAPQAGPPGLAPPGLGQPPSARRTAQMNVAAHRRMGLRTVNQQPQFDSSALRQMQSSPPPILREIRGRTPPPFMEAGTARLRPDVGADPRGPGPKKEEKPGFGPMKKARPVRWGDTGRDPLMQRIAERHRKQQLDRQWEEKPPVQQAIQQSLTDEEKRQEEDRRRRGPYGSGIGGKATGPIVMPRKPPRPGPLPPQPTKKPFKKPRRRVTFGGKEFRTIPNVLREREDREQYMAAGRHLGIKQGRHEAARQHRMTQMQMQRQNQDLMGLITGMKREGATLEARVRAGGRQLGAREDAIKSLQAGMGRQGLQLQTAQARIKRGGEQIGSREAEIRRLNVEGRRLESAAQQKVSELQAGMGREGIGRQRAEQRTQQLLQEGRSLDASSKKQIRQLQEGMGREGLARQQAQNEVRRLQGEVSQAKSSGSADRQRLERELAAAKASLAESRRAPRAAPAAAPIITVSAPGGGGASSSAGGAAAGGQAPAAAAPDLSKVVEAVKRIAESVQAAKKKEPAGKAGSKGITQARRRYTDKRKTTLAALRALKSKRIREFNTKTKKLPKAERNKQRREFRQKVNSQYKEVTTKFPTARGMKSVATIRELIKKLEGIKA